MRRLAVARCNLPPTEARLRAVFVALPETRCSLLQMGRRDKMSEDAKFILGFGQ